jgi:hypothetical protein
MHTYFLNLLKKGRKRFSDVRWEEKGAVYDITQQGNCSFLQGRLAVVNIVKLTSLDGLGKENDCTHNFDTETS